MTINKTTTGPGKFIIGETADLTVFDSQVTSITLEPSVNKGDAKKVLSGETAPGDRTETWVIKGSMFSDFGSTDSLVEYCFTHRGQEQPFRFTPATASGKEITGRLTVEATAIGGDVGETPEPEFEFELVGDPILGTIPTPPGE